MVTAGRVLAGLAPAMLLLAVTCESALSVAAFGLLGLAVGSVLGLRALFLRLEGLESWSRTSARLLRFAFVSFALVLGVRIWWALLPVLGGAT